MGICIFLAQGSKYINENYKYSCICDSVYILFFHQPPGMRWGAHGSSQVTGGARSQHLHREQRGEDPTPDGKGWSGEHTSSDRGGMMCLLINKSNIAAWIPTTAMLNIKCSHLSQSPLSSLAWHIQMCNRWEMSRHQGGKLDWTEQLLRRRVRSCADTLLH